MVSQSVNIAIQTELERCQQDSYHSEIQSFEWIKALHDEGELSIDIFLSSFLDHFASLFYK